MIITCEHAGNEIPDQYKSLFWEQDEVLRSHRGWDPGAFDIGELLAKELHAPFFYTKTSRLVVEANRSLHSEQLFSSFTNTLSFKEKDLLLKEFYCPYRNRVEDMIGKMSKPVLHLSMHSFTPVLGEAVRTTDIGLLFDPSRRQEHKFCISLQQRLQSVFAEFQIDFNQPYKGTDDGFTTYLRTKFTDAIYSGIEIEVNQKFMFGERSNQFKVKLANAIRDYITDLQA